MLETEDAQSGSRLSPYLEQNLFLLFMSCFLRATGRRFDVDAFLESTSIEPDVVFRKGELFERGPKRGQRRLESGFAIQITSGFGAIRKQASRVIKFLQVNKAGLTQLSKLTSVTDIRLDFGYELRHQGLGVQCDYLPPELIKLAGELRIGIELSLYSGFGTEG